MTTTYILGDNVPRKSNFDPFLAEKLTRYYEEHPEELEKPISQMVESSPVREYVFMRQTETYALGLQALRKECIKENNQNHPKFIKPDGSTIYRPLTFKENIQAHVDNYEKTHNSDGSERTIDERISLIAERWNDSCTAIVYKKCTTKFKIVPISEHLINLNPNFKKTFRRVNYSAIKGMELDSKDEIYNTNITKEDVLNHPAWLAAVEGDKFLLKCYTNIIFDELKRKYARTEEMTFWVRQNTPTNELRALYIGSLKYHSDTESNNLGSIASFLRVVPHEIRQVHELKK